LWQHLVHHHQPVLIGIRQWFQHHGVDDAEDRAGGADAERQREDGDQRESGRLAHLAERVTRVGEHVGKHEEDSWSFGRAGLERVGQPVEASL
jgi:hypothetical protein